MSEETFFGPLTRKEQMDYLQQQLEDALQKGAKLCLGGKQALGAGYYFEPTILAETHHEMRFMKEESFGPIIGIQKVLDEGRL